MLAKHVDAKTTEDAALAGASLTLGVLPLAIAGTFIFTMEDDGIRLEPVFVDSLLFVGFVFPVVMGAIGGFLWARQNE